MASNGSVEDRILDNAASTGRNIQNHMLFEISTEAANRGGQPLAAFSIPWLTVFPVGGIYSVIKSKAPVTTAEYGDRYTLIGPLNRASASSSEISPEILS